MLGFIRSELPLICSAYAAALFGIFGFFYASTLDYFVLINLLLFAFWSSYAWFIVWDQDKTIDEMQKTMQVVRDTIEKIIIESEQENKV
jgi:hypothetical protein